MIQQHTKTSLETSLPSNLMNEFADFDIFYLAFGILRTAIKKVEPGMRYYIHPGARWKK